MLGPFTTASRLTPIQQMSLAVLSRAACASMSTTTTTRDRGDRYGPMEWAQKLLFKVLACSLIITLRSGSVVVAGTAAVVAIRVALVEISDCRRAPAPTTITVRTAYNAQYTIVTIASQSYIANFALPAC